MTKMRIRDDSSSAFALRLEELIYDFNVDATDVADGLGLQIEVRNVDELIAGLSGHTWGGVAEIKVLWVAGAWRRRGLGTRLLEAAEGEARRRGCRQVVLATHSFQGPDFYPRFGYSEFARLRDYPTGHDQLYFRKAL